MAAASEIITDALGELFNSAGEQPVVAEEMSSGIRYLNRMMSAWSASGLALGFTTITSPSDTITVADGALDGIVCDTTLAKNKGFIARWGTSCGIPFNAKEFCERNIQWAEQEPYLIDRPEKPWTTFFMKNKIERKTKKNKKSHKRYTKKKIIFNK